MRGIGDGKREWMDSQEIMELLHLSARTLQTWRSKGVLPFSKVGNKIFYKRCDLDELLQGGVKFGKEARR